MTASNINLEETRRGTVRVSPKLRKLLNDQIALEANASNYYLTMASWCEFTGYEGASAFFFSQSDEERQHMLKIVHFLNGRGISADIPPVKKTAGGFKSLEGLMKTALKNEQAVTAAITKMVEMSSKEKDHATFTFLQWFVDEQMQEEEKFEAILRKFELIGRDKLAVNEIDKMLGGMPAEAAADPAQ